MELGGVDGGVTSSERFVCGSTCRRAARPVQTNRRGQLPPCGRDRHTHLEHRRGGVAVGARPGPVRRGRGRGSRSSRVGTEPALATGTGCTAASAGWPTGWPRSGQARPWTAREEAALAASIGERLRAVSPTQHRRRPSSTGWPARRARWSLLGRAGLGRRASTGCWRSRRRTAGRSMQRRRPLGDRRRSLARRRCTAATRGGCASRRRARRRTPPTLLLAEAEETPAGLNWLFVPRRLVPPDKLDQGRPVEMPNWSHGLAGIAAALARRRCSPSPAPTSSRRPGEEPSTSSRWPTRRPWRTVASPYLAGSRTRPRHGRVHLELVPRPWLATSRSSTPSRRQESARLRASRRQPGSRAACTRRTPRASPSAATRASGTTTAAAAALPEWPLRSLPHDRSFALALADDLVERAYVEGDRVYWRFSEHRNDEPLLGPALGGCRVPRASRGSCSRSHASFPPPSRAAAGGRPSPSARRCRPPRCGR